MTVVWDEDNESEWDDLYDLADDDEEADADEFWDDDEWDDLYDYSEEE